MAFDPSTLLDVSHLVTFVGGAILGAAGQYLGDRFTDSRRAKEQVAHIKKKFKNLQEQMPELLQEMKADLQAEGASMIREFVLLPNARVTFNHGKPRFQYYAEIHPHLQTQVDLIRDAGFVDELDSTSVPMYRMHEHFVEALNKN
ncbi:hypothetical protein ACI48D_08780 [Massilia sp. LXY-6]|uniref:hypothetical protein n=1 Tax=Massilia sp. LXY-6 TaxID=3379823 RepID=UPI003EDFF2AA